MHSLQSIGAYSMDKVSIRFWRKVTTKPQCCMFKGRGVRVSRDFTSGTKELQFQRRS